MFFFFWQLILVFLRLLKSITIIWMVTVSLWLREWPKMTLVPTHVWQKTVWEPLSHWVSFMLKVRTTLTWSDLFYLTIAAGNLSTPVCSPEPPIIDGDLHTNRIEPLGGNAILSCEVQGDPPPTIQWSKNGVNIQISNRIRQLDNGSLAIYGTVVGKTLD